MKKYFGNCVNWSPSDVPALCGMIDSAIDITRSTFLKHVNRDDLRELEADLAYAAHPASAGVDYGRRLCGFLPPEQAAREKGLLF